MDLTPRFGYATEFSNRDDPRLEIQAKSFTINTNGTPNRNIGDLCQFLLPRKILLPKGEFQANIYAVSIFRRYL
jgi:hypothetical protein